MKYFFRKIVTMFIVLMVAFWIPGCLPSPDVHEHTFSEIWSFDVMCHWHDASCEHKSQQTNKEGHRFGEYVSNNDATMEADGTKSRICLVCKFKETVQDEGSKKNGFVKIEFESGDFYIAQTELTYSEWYEVYQWAVKNGYIFQDLGKEGAFGEDGAKPTLNSRQPVTYVSWRDAVVWCNAASEKEGLTPVYEYEGGVLKEAENFAFWDHEELKWYGTNPENKTNKDAEEGKAENSTVNANANGYRLPTEAEWEYAAKGGKNFQYSGSDNIDEVGWYWWEGMEESGFNTKDVGQKQPNDYGLYDMSGNVWEWCQDQDICTDGSNARVAKGGSFYNPAECSTVSFRDFIWAFGQSSMHGFRVCRSAK